MLSPHDVELIYVEHMRALEKSISMARLLAQIPRRQPRWRQKLARTLEATRAFWSNAAKGRFAESIDDLMQPEFSGVWIALSLIVVLLSAAALMPA